MGVRYHLKKQIGRPAKNVGEPLFREEVFKLGGVKGSQGGREYGSGLLIQTIKCAILSLSTKVF